MCRFLINTNLGIPADKGLKMICDEKEIIFKIIKNNITSFIPFKGNEVNWLDTEDAFKSELSFSSESEEIILQEIYIGLNDKFDYGYNQHSISNIAEVIFEENPLKPFSEPDNHAEYSKIAKKYLDNFIDIYRYFTSNGYIMNPKYFVSPLVDMLICKGYSIKDIEKTDEIKNLCFKSTAFQIQSEPPYPNVFNSFILTNDLMDKFSYYLKSDYKLDLYQKIILDAREKVFIFKDYPLSIVLIETAFEAFTRKLLIELCTELEINTLYSKYKKSDVPFEEAIESGNIIADLLKGYLDTLLNIRIEDTSEFKAWNEDACKKRNKIVHRGINSYRYNDAETAFTSTITFIDYIINISNTFLDSVNR
jgi:hypothetical protein